MLRLADGRPKGDADLKLPVHAHENLLVRLAVWLAYLRHETYDRCKVAGGMSTEDLISDGAQFEWFLGPRTSLRPVGTHPRGAGAWR
jgi:hypothetical protein